MIYDIPHSVDTCSNLKEEFWLFFFRIVIFGFYFTCSFTKLTIPSYLKLVSDFDHAARCMYCTALYLYMNCTTLNVMGFSPFLFFPL